MPAAAPEDRFGKAAPIKTESDEPKELKSKLAGRFQRWENGTVINLENGQRWKVISHDRGYYPDIPDNADVTITRSFFGAYWLVVAPTDRPIKVRRIK